MQTLWEEANRRAHQRFIQVVKDEGGENVSTTGGNVTIDLRGLLTQVAQQVGLSGKPVASSSRRTSGPARGHEARMS